MNLDEIEVLYEKLVTAKRAYSRSHSDPKEYYEAVRHLNGVDSMFTSALHAAFPKFAALARAADELDKLIGGKQLAQIGPEVARKCVFAKRKIQDSIASLNTEAGV